MVKSRHVLAAAVTFLAVVAAPALLSHPLHTTLTEFTQRSGRQVLHIEVRVFADDFFRAAMRREPPLPAVPDVPDSVASVYARTHLAITGPDGAALPLRWCAMRRTGDVVWLCLEAPWTRTVRGLRVAVLLHTELYRDQINIVQASYDGRRQSLLFTSGDGPQRLP